MIRNPQNRKDSDKGPVLGLNLAKRNLVNQSPAT